MPSTTQSLTLGNLVNFATLTVILIGGLKVVLPMQTVPGDMKELQNNVRIVQQVQAVQAENLKALTDVVKETGLLRRDLDQAKAQLSAQITVTDNRVTSAQIRITRLERGAVNASALNTEN